MADATLRFGFRGNPKHRVASATPLEGASVRVNNDLAAIDRGISLSAQHLMKLNPSPEP